jgi:DNA replication and repair protein RecF
MYLSHLSLTNFRNYARLELELPPQAIIVAGDNAQGKSNLLEAIYLLATTRSFRAGSDRELINWLALAEEEIPFARLLARVQKEHSSLRIEIAISQSAGADLPVRPAGGLPSVGGNVVTNLPPHGGAEGTRANAVRPEDGAGAPVKQAGRLKPGAPNVNGASSISKRIKVNNVARRAIDLIGQVNVVMFSPQDIELVSGSPQMRRRYLDVTISQVDPRYCRTLAHYNRVLMQRNHLLRQIRERHASADQLLFWDQELANAGAYVILQRLETIAVLDELTFGLHRRLTGSQERLHILPRLSLDTAIASSSSNGVADGEGVGVAAGFSLRDPRDAHTLEEKVHSIADVFRQQLVGYQHREIAYGMSLVGPHRDDLGFLVDDRDMNVYGSRGQQRTIALSLKLAEMEFMRKRTGEEPILLLDDVASELDAQRRHHVVAAARAHQQVIITTTDLDAFEPDFFGNALLLRVENGALCSI